MAKKTLDRLQEMKKYICTRGQTAPLPAHYMVRLIDIFINEHIAEPAEPPTPTLSDGTPAEVGMRVRVVDEPTCRDDIGHLQIRYARQTGEVDSVTRGLPNLDGYARVQFPYNSPDCLINVDLHNLVAAPAESETHDEDVRDSEGKTLEVGQFVRMADKPTQEPGSRYVSSTDLPFAGWIGIITRVSPDTVGVEYRSPGNPVSAWPHNLTIIDPLAELERLRESNQSLMSRVAKLECMRLKAYGTLKGDD